MVEIGRRIGVKLFLVTGAVHLAGAEGGVEGQLLVLAVELFGLKQVERVVDVVVVAGGGLEIVQRVVVEQVGGIAVAVALTVAAAQLVGE